MTNKEFKDEVFSRAEKQITKRKKTIKAICASALSVALVLLLIPVSVSFFSNAAPKGDMAYGRDSQKEEFPAPGQSDNDTKENNPTGDLAYENLEIFDYSIGGFITADFTQKKEIVEILNAIRTEALQKGTSITSSQLENEALCGTYRLKITFSGTKFYIGEDSVCFGLKELKSSDYLKNLLKIIEK